MRRAGTISKKDGGMHHASRMEIAYAIAEGELTKLSLHVAQRLFLTLLPSADQPIARCSLEIIPNLIADHVVVELFVTPLKV